MTISLQFLTIVVPIIAVVIGYYYSKRLEVLKENRKFKADLFSQFIKTSNKYNNIKSAKDEEIINNEYSEICEKLCLYADENVLNNLAKLNDGFNKEKNYIKTTEGKKIYTDLILSMRKDVGLKGNKFNDDTILKVLDIECSN